jgi:hypothetical protein
MLADVERFFVPSRIVEHTEESLREAGSNGYEMFVLWSGCQRGRAFDIKTPHVPKQMSYRLESGLCVRVEGPELHRLNMWLYESGEMLAVQVHAHPTDAYHSETDDSYPIVATLGGLSIVVPDFCGRGVFTKGTAIYRLEPKGWIEQPSGLVEVT